MIPVRFFGQKCVLRYCVHCARIFKHGKWVILTTEESLKLSKRHTGFTLIEDECSFCKEERALGVV